MALNDTNLIIQAAQLPPTFDGSPQELFAAMIRRMKIVSPSGTNFIFIGDVEPSSNVGPWLRFGTQWWVYSTATNRYIPLDISASERHWFWTGSATPASSTPPFWLRTATGATIDTPPTTSYGRALGWYVFDGSVWRPFDGIVNSGTTAERPGSPLDLERYYDTDLSAEIWFERGSWRTTSGLPGDIKAVAWPTLAEALRRNPGWSLLGAANVSIRGRGISQATKDQTGSGGTTDLTTDFGVPHREVGETFGETQGLTGAVPLTITLPPQIAYFHLVKD